MGEFLEREQGNHTEIAVVRLEIPPTPGSSGSEERPATPVTLETSVGGLGTPPVHGETSTEARPATPPNPGTPVVEHPVQGSLATHGHHLHQVVGRERTPVKVYFGFLLSRRRIRVIHPLRLDRRLTGLRNMSQSCKPVTLKLRPLLLRVTKREARVPTGPANPGNTTQGGRGLTTQCKGIKKTFPCLWLSLSSSLSLSCALMWDSLYFFLSVSCSPFSLARSLCRP